MRKHPITLSSGLHLEDDLDTVQKTPLEDAGQVFFQFCLDLKSDKDTALR